jgi:hypothetical protein
MQLNNTRTLHQLTEVEVEVNLRPPTVNRPGSWCHSSIWSPRPDFFLSKNCGFLDTGHSLTRGWVSNLLVQMLLSLARAVTLESNTPRKHVHILLSRFRLPQPGGSGSHIYILWNKVAQLYSRALGSLFVASYDSQGYSGGIQTRHHTGAKQHLYKCWDMHSYRDLEDARSAVIPTCGNTNPQ